MTSNIEDAWLGRIQNVIDAMDSSLFSPLPSLPNTKPRSSASGTFSSNMTLRERKKPVLPSQAKSRTSDKLQSTNVTREDSRAEPKPLPKSNHDTMAKPSEPGSGTDPHISPHTLKRAGSTVYASGSNQEPLKIRIKVPPKYRPGEDKVSMPGHC